MTTQGRRGGRPLIALFAILAVWVGVRAIFWELPFALPAPSGLFTKARTDGMGEASGTAFANGEGALQVAAVRRLRPKMTAAHWDAVRAEGAGPGGGGRASLAILAHPAAAAQLARSNLSASHQLLYAAAFAFAPSYDRLSQAEQRGSGDQSAPLPWSQASAPPSSPARWSADAWLLVRQGGSGPVLASVGPASYGGNQLGAVVRYSLAPRSSLQPQAYARASKGLMPGGESEAAAGVSIGLARSFPLRVHGELRVTDRPGGTEVRPAAFVVTGLPRRKVGPMIEAEGYLQAGYVGGDYETGFVDGRAIVEAPVIRSERGQVALGGGVWGGAQRGAARLDLGPTASATLATGRATVRGSVDYRLRVAGDAVPGDGLAVTLAASF